MPGPGSFLVPHDARLDGQPIRVQVDLDTLGVAEALHEYHRGLYLEAGLPNGPARGKFFVMYDFGDGRPPEQVLTWDTAQGGPINATVIHKLFKADREKGHDPVARWFAESEAREAAEDAAFDEKLREDTVPRLLHALRMDGEPDAWPLSIAVPDAPTKEST